MNIVEPIRKISDLNKIRKSLKDYDYKYYLLFEYGITTGLRISDILSLKAEDIVNKEFLEIREQKTGKYKKFPIHDYLRQEMTKYIKKNSITGFLWESPFYKCNKPINRTHVYRVLNYCAKRVGYFQKIGTHTMRKTFGYHFYRQTKDICLLQKIFNHSSPSVTLCYIGLTQEKINEAYNSFTYKEIRKNDDCKNDFSSETMSKQIYQLGNKINQLNQYVEKLEDTLTKCMNYGFDRIDKLLSY